MKRIMITMGALLIVAGCSDGPADPTEPDPPTPPAEPLPGMMTITFDDGWKSTYTRAFPTLEAHDLPGNVAVVTDYIDLGFAAFLSLGQLQELHAAGWSMVSHTVSHADLTLLTEEELEVELGDSRSWIEERGFRGSSIFIVPFHSFGERELAAIRQHYSAARIANSDFYFPERLEDWPPGDPHRLTSIEAEFAPFTTEAGRAALEGQIEAALEDGKFVDVLFHDIEAEDYAAFQETVEMLARFRADIRAYHELFGPGS